MVEENVTVFCYLIDESNAAECLLSFVIEVKKRIESKKILKLSIPEEIYRKISKLEFKEIFYDQINEIEGFDQYLQEVIITRTKDSELNMRSVNFEIIEIKKK